MFASTVLNYMDRQSIALVGPQIRREFGIDFEGFGWVITAFGLAYALFQIPAGMLVDRLDARPVYAGAVTFWSLAAIACAFSPSLGMLIGFRALLGVGESFNWPCALRVTRQILPTRDRSLGNGIFNSGAAVGAVLTPLCVPLLAKMFGWRLAFLVIGAAGFVWVAAWLALIGSRRFDWNSSSAEVGTEPVASIHGSSPRTKLAMSLVCVIACAVLTAGFLQPVFMDVALRRVRPESPLKLRNWRVKVGDSVKRNQALAELEAATQHYLFKSLNEGRVTKLLAPEGDEASAGQPLIELDDSLGPLTFSLEWVEPSDRPARVNWLVSDGAPVNAGQPIANVEADGGFRGIALAPLSGRIVRIKADASGPAAEARFAIEVRGFDANAWGLPSIWVGVAVLMLGVLLVARVLPLPELGSGWMGSFGRMVRFSRFWVLVVVSCTINLAWHFLVNWLPTYLQTDRGMTYLAGGLFAALPFLAADAGNLGGGALTRWLCQRGFDAARARLMVMGVCVVLISAGAWVGLIPTKREWEPLVVLLLCLMALGAAGYMANYFAFCQDVSAPLTGLVVGCLGGLGNLVAAGFNPVAGRLKDSTGSFALVFLLVGTAPAIGLVLLAVAWGRDRRTESEQEPLESA
jgi:MFS family permease